MSTSELTRKEFVSGGVKGGLAVLAGASMLSLAAKPVFAFGGGEFYAIITNFGSAPRPSAHLDVSLDTQYGGEPVDFHVFDADGALLAEFTLTTSANGFVSSASAAAPNRNFFRLTNEGPRLRSTAVLRSPVGKWNGKDNLTLPDTL